MNWIENLKQQLEMDEGVVYGVYKDTKGLYTCGIGHLITKADPELYEIQKAHGDLSRIKLTRQRVDELFAQDVKKHIEECKKVFDDFDDFADDVKEIIANMMFNLGYARFLGFKNFISAIKAKRYFEACEEMIDSKWFFEVKGRSKRLVEKMSYFALSYHKI